MMKKGLHENMHICKYCFIMNIQNTTQLLQNCQWPMYLCCTSIAPKILENLARRIAKKSANWSSNELHYINVFISQYLYIVT